MNSCFFSNLHWKLIYLFIKCPVCFSHFKFLVWVASLQEAFETGHLFIFLSCLFDFWQISCFLMSFILNLHKSPSISYEWFPQLQCGWGSEVISYTSATYDPLALVCHRHQTLITLGRCQRQTWMYGFVATTITSWVKLLNHCAYRHSWAGTLLHSSDCLQRKFAVGWTLSNLDRNFLCDKDIFLYWWSQVIPFWLVQFTEDDNLQLPRGRLLYIS